jgi:hypothetical protein
MRMYNNNYTLLSALLNGRSRKSSVGQGSIPGRARYFYRLPSAYTGSGAKPAYYRMHIGELFPWG